MRFDNVWRLIAAQALAVASVGGAAASSSAFGTQTYAIQLSYPGSTSSTGGCRIAIVSPNDNAVSSTAGTLLPANWVEVLRCSPGQRVSAISNDAGTFSLSITELTDWWQATSAGLKTCHPTKHRRPLMLSLRIRVPLQFARLLNFRR